MANRKTCLLAIDAGTTHCKVGVFSSDGDPLLTTSLPTPISTAAQGFRFIPPEELWSGIAGAIAEFKCTERSFDVAGIGIASTAESGLLVDRSDGSARSVIFPWFDTTAGEQIEAIQKASQQTGESGSREQFLNFGIYPSFKCSLAKILWARQNLAADLRNAVWLSVADFIANRLAGCFATDYSLAGRTYAFRIIEKTWDADWLKQFDLPTELFPTALPAGRSAGRLLPGPARALDLPAGLPVSIAGHDHICAALAVGAITPGIVLDSMGTAEAMVGAIPERALSDADYQSGFSIGCHVAPGSLYWIGGLSTSGGAVDWLRKTVSEGGLSYEELASILEKSPQETGEVLFFPYLAGSGSPHPDQEVRGAFVGLTLRHQLPDLVKAVLEGTAFEVELMRLKGEALTGQPIDRLIATGGGVRIPRWMQIKADVTGCCYELAQTPEAVLLGAALIAGTGAGLYSGVEEGLKAITRPAESIYLPDAERHARYQAQFEGGFLKLQQPLRNYYRK